LHCIENIPLYSIAATDVAHVNVAAGKVSPIAVVKRDFSTCLWQTFYDERGLCRDVAQSEKRCLFVGFFPAPALAFHNFPRFSLEVAAG